MKQLINEFNLLVVLMGVVYLIGLAYIQHRDEAVVAKSSKQKWCSVRYNTYTETRPCTIENELGQVARLDRK